MRYFGFAALLGLLGWWIFNRDALHVRATEPRTLTASYYSEECRGKVTTSGDIFNPDKLTGASWEFYKKKLRVTGPKGSVVIFINDHGPHRRLLKTRQLDLSRAAFERIADLRVGLVRVRVEVL